MSIRLATTEDEIRACYPVMGQLRPDYDTESFTGQVRRQQESGYRLAALSDREGVAAVAGFRVGENLAWGKHLYVDDLVTDRGRRSTGHGETLMEWLVKHARQAGCRELHLDSGVQRFRAHRFYLRFGMDITSHHFYLGVGPE